MTNDELTSFWNDNYLNDRRYKVTLHPNDDGPIPELTSALRMYDNQGNYPWTVYLATADNRAWVEIPINRILSIVPLAE